MKKDTILKVESTDRDFAYWLNRPYVDGKLRALLSTANLLIVPREDYPGHEGPIFPQGTDEFLKFLTHNSPKDVTAEACISDEDYTDLILHHDWFDVGIMVVQSVFAPVAVSLIVGYINKQRRNSSRITVKLTIVETDNSAKQISYEGPKEDFESAITQALKSNDPGGAIVLPSPPATKRLFQDETKQDGPKSDQAISSRGTE